MEEFDYNRTVARLDEIARKVEDPSAGLDEIDKYIAETRKLVGEARAYLRKARQTNEDDI